RQVLFNTPRTLGQHTFPMEVQSTPLCLGEHPDHSRFQEPCVENHQWRDNRVTYATLNVQGSCNNRCGDAADPAEYNQRNGAVIAWMRDTFAEAKAFGSVAVMLIGQADPGFDKTDGTRTLLRDPMTLVQDPS